MCIQSSVIKIFWNSGWSSHSFSYLLWWSNGGDIVNKPLVILNRLSFHDITDWHLQSLAGSSFSDIQLGLALGHPLKDGHSPSDISQSVTHAIFWDSSWNIFWFLLKCCQDGCCRVSEGFKFTECGDWVSSWPQSRGKRGLVARGWGRGCDWSTDVTHLEKG